MGCSISRQEVRGRGKEPSLLSFSHNLDDVSRRDRDRDRPSTLSNNSQSLSVKLVKRQIVGRNNVSSEKEDFVLGETNELLIPETEGLKYPPSSRPPNGHTKPPLPDPSGGGAMRKSSNSGKTENTRVEAEKQTITNNHEGNDDELEEKGAVIPKFEGPMWIASPSFRYYCNPDGDSDDDNRFFEDNNDTENITNTEDHVEVRQGDNSIVIQREDSPSRSSVKRRRNLKKVLTMHGQIRVRNLFSVATCYNPTVPSAHNGHRKSHGKTV